MKAQIASASGLFILTLFMAVSLCTAGMAPADATTLPTTAPAAQTAN